MRFNINRMAKLAGLQSGRGRSGLLREGAGHEQEGMDYHEGSDYDMSEEDMSADMLGEGEEDDEEKNKDADENEEIEVDEAVLVQELRRMKNIMAEAKKKAVVKRQRRKENLQEAQLKALIDAEVKHVLKDLGMKSDSSWMYGNRQPTRSKKGYVNHGSFLKGFGFK